MRYTTKILEKSFIWINLLQEHAKRPAFLETILQRKHVYTIY
jgi:hypothetical protein